MEVVKNALLSVQHVTMKKKSTQTQNNKEQKAHSFDLFDAGATRRDAQAPTAAMFLARST